MGLGILSVKYRNETRGDIDLPYLKACIGEKIKVVVELYFDQIFIPYDVDDKIAIFVPDPGISGRPYNNDLLYFSESDFLNESQIGDIYFCNVGDVFTFTLLEKITDNIGRFDVDFSTFFDSVPFTINDSGQLIANITPLKSLIYQYGINELGQYISFVDGSLQKFSIDSTTKLTDISSQSLIATGNKDWQIDSNILYGLGNDPDYNADVHPRIRLIHEVVISPFYLSGQYDNMLLGISPDYFKPDNKIKYQAQIDWNKSSSFLDPNKSLVLDPVGQFGWFGTKYNGDPSIYKITSLTIQRVSDSEFINQLEYNEVEVKFNIASDSPAFDEDSRLIFGFNYLPEDQELYQNTNRFLEENFCFESKLFTPDNTPVNGNNFGTSDQIIKTINGNIIDSQNCLVTVKILFGNNRADILKQEDIAQYAIWVISENTSLDIEVTDKSNLLIQVDTIHVQLTKADLLNDVTKFIEHPYNSVASGKDTLQMFPVDDIAVNSLFSLDYTGIDNDGIILKSCTPKIILTHTDEADITLDSFRINLENFPLIGSSPSVQAIDFNHIRPYKIEDGIRKVISFERDFNSDTLSTKYFALNFPFMNRWEYWLKIIGLISIPSSLFDPSVPFNGGNNLWDRLANSSGWTLAYRITFEIIQNGKLFEQDFEHVLTSTYFESNTDWNNCNIKTYDINTNQEIISGPKKFAYAATDTKVICSFEKTSGDILDIDNVAIVIWAEGFEGSGISEITRISSVYDVINTSIFKSSDNSNKVKITKTGSVFTGEALIDFNKIQNISKLSLYARIYEITGSEEDGRITNDFILRFTNDGQTRLILS